MICCVLTLKAQSIIFAYDARIVINGNIFFFAFGTGNSFGF